MHFSEKIDRPKSWKFKEAREIQPFSKINANTQYKVLIIASKIACIQNVVYFSYLWFVKAKSKKNTYV